MDNNKHPHYDLIVELISDTSKQVEMVTGSNSVVQVEAYNVVADKKGGYIFRIKPREFIKGHWYPCLRDDGTVLVRMFDGLGMSLGVDLGLSINPLQFKDIGKSLGEIKFDE